MQIIKVPGLNNPENEKGCRNASNSILKELNLMRDISFSELEEIHVDNGDLDGQFKLIYKNSKESFEIQDKLIFLGGDHSISYPICKAFMDVFGEENSYLIVFDACPNCLPLIDNNFPSNVSWLKKLVESNFNPNNIILVGLRKITFEERQFLDEKKIKYWEMDKFSDVEALCDGVMEFVNKPNGKFYFSLDVSVIDPAFAPATEYLDPGGFTSREILYFIRRITMLKNLRGFDIVELNSDKDRNFANLTAKLSAKILKEVIE